MPHRLCVSVSFVLFLSQFLYSFPLLSLLSFHFLPGCQFRPLSAAFPFVRSCSRVTFSHYFFLYSLFSPYCQLAVEVASNSLSAVALCSFNASFSFASLHLIFSIDFRMQTLLLLFAHFTFHFQVSTFYFRIQLVLLEEMSIISKRRPSFYLHNLYFSLLKLLLFIFTRFFISSSSSICF